MTSAINTRAVEVAPQTRTAQNPSRVYFPALNHLRFVAAAGVVIHHLEQIKGSFGLPNCMDLWIATAVGKEGVRLFFVLSGFLITYLLLLERQITGRLQVKAFYKRRILRIWPLYFLMVLGSFVLLPVFLDFTGLLPTTVSAGMHKLHQDFLTKLALYCSFFPNVSVHLYDPVYGGGHLWSIAAEEQFYLIWPILVCCFFRNPLLGFAIALIAKFAIVLACQHASIHSSWWSAVTGSIQTNGVESFVAGATVAWLYHRHKSLTAAVSRHPLAIVICTAAIVSCMLFELPCYQFLMNIGFAWLVVYQCQQPARQGRIVNWVRYLGTISYGIYMYHPIVIFVVLTLFGCALKTMNPFVMNIVCYGTISAFTILLAACSYEFFEKVFLKQKEGLAVIKTGSEKS